MFFLRRLIGRFLFVALLGWLINKLRRSDNPKAQKVGHTANRVLGGVFGVDAAGRPAMGRSRRAGRSAGTAAVGGLLGYFFDPVQGRDRRERVKTFASERLQRNGPLARPAATFSAAPAASSPAQSRSNITALESSEPTSTKPKRS